MLKKSTIAVFVSFLFVSTVCAQKKKRKHQKRSPQQQLEYHDKNYLSAIQSVEFYNSELEQSLPLLQLNSPGTLVLAFDDLRADYRHFYFSLEHCDIDWKKSSLSPLEYSAGYGEDQIVDILPSRNTITPYTHYEVTLPTENVKPLISGNYLLKVYEDGDKSRLLLTRRFFVVDQKTSVRGEITPSLQVNLRKSHQKINLRVNTQALQINDPLRDINVIVTQNNRPDLQMMENKPNQIRNNELVYNRPDQFNFPAGQEFLYVDLRSIRLQSAMVKSIETDSLIHVELFPDNYFDNLRYTETPDENGRFYIRNQDHDGNVTSSSEYMFVTFDLQTDFQPNETIYLLGKFNNYNRAPENELSFDSKSQSWKVTKWLKQGVYDYIYALGNRFQPLNGSVKNQYFEAGNSYQVFVYYRNPRLNRDELVGFTQLENHLTSSTN